MYVGFKKNEWEIARKKTDLDIIVCKIPAKYTQSLAIYLYYTNPQTKKEMKKVIKEWIAEKVRIAEKWFGKNEITRRIREKMERSIVFYP